MSDGYTCDKCGRSLTKAEGGSVFSVCDDCWDRRNDPAPVPSEVEAALGDPTNDLASLWRAAKEQPKNYFNASRQYDRVSKHLATLTAECERLRNLAHNAKADSKRAFDEHFASDKINRAAAIALYSLLADIRATLAGDTEGANSHE